MGSAYTPRSERYRDAPAIGQNRSSSIAIHIVDLICVLAHPDSMQGTRQWINIGLLALVSLATFACQRTFRASVSQPNPLISPTETLRTSEQVAIVTGDMELRMPRRIERSSANSSWVDERYPLQNVASFTVVSRDRLRFHVQVEHKWQEWADLSSWKAYLIDDSGRRYEPQDIDGRQPEHIVTMWDYESRSVVRDHFGDVIAVRRDGHKRRKPMMALSVFRGHGDVVFHRPDIFTPNVKRLTLVIERATLAFSWTWKFADDEEGPPGASGQVHYRD